MIRITINWDFISPTLQTVSGIVHLDYIPDHLTNTRLTSFRTTAKPGSISYKSLDDNGIPTVYLDAVKFKLDAIVRSYKQGVIMDKQLYSWIINKDVDDTKEALLKVPDKIGSHSVYYGMTTGDPDL